MKIETKRRLYHSLSYIYKYIHNLLLFLIICTIFKGKMIDYFVTYNHTIHIPNQTLWFQGIIVFFWIKLSRKKMYFPIMNKTHTTLEPQNCINKRKRVSVEYSKDAITRGRKGAINA